MLSDTAVETLADLLTAIYPDPEIEHVPLPPPEPYEVEVEDEVLDPETDAPCRKPRRVTVGAEDYPVKHVEVTRFRRRSHNVPYEKDLGPTHAYLIVPSILWALCAVLLLWNLLSHPSTLWSYPILLLGVSLGLQLRGYLRKTRRRTTTLTNVAWEWVSFSDQIALEVDEAYQPRTEERRLPNPERVVALGEVNLSFEARPAGDGSLVVDCYGLGAEPEVVLPCLEDAEAVQSLAAELDDTVAELPIVLCGDRQDVPTELEGAFELGVPLRGAEARLFELFSTIEGLFDGAEQRHLRPNILPAGHPLLPLLEPLEAGSREPSMANDDLIQLERELEASGFEELAQQALTLSSTWRRNTALLGCVRLESLHHQVAPMLREFGHVSHYSSFHFYCPHCVGEQVQELMDRDYSISSETETAPVDFSPNSRCLYSLDDGTWVCQTCERTVEHPIPVHKLLDDVLFPAYDRLIEENKPARLELDSKSRDATLAYSHQLEQEADDLERQLHLGAAETTSDIERIRAEMEGDVKAIAGIQEVMSQYRLEQSEALAQIGRSSQQIQQSIEAETQAVLTHVDQVFEQRMVEYRQEMHQLAVSKRKEDMIRDSIRAGILMGVQDIAHSSRATAANTARIAEHTEDIAHSSRATAVNTARIAEHTEDIAQSSRATAANTANIAEHTGEMRGTLRSIQKAQETGNAIQAAVAKQRGVDLHNHSFWRIDKHLQRWAAGAATTLSGGSDLDREDRVLKALK